MIELIDAKARKRIDLTSSLALSVSLEGEEFRVFGAAVDEPTLLSQVLTCPNVFASGVVPEGDALAGASIVLGSSARVGAEGKSPDIDVV